MSAAGWRGALALTRPRQWPILTAQLLVGVLLAQPDRAGLAALLQGGALAVLGAAWVAWVVLLNGGTLAYNSAWDRDTGPVAYLRRPPQPPPGLAHAAFAAMLAGALLGGLAVGPRFGAVTAACVMLSVLYSHPDPRLKARPGLDLLVNMVGYGAATTLAGLVAGRVATGVEPGPHGAWLVGGFGLLFGSFYPLTQIYQTAADRARGDRTLVTALGVRPALVLALVLGAAAGAALVRTVPADRPTWPVAAACGLWLLHLAWWLARAEHRDDRAHERGMYTALVLWAVVDAALVLARFA